MKTRVLVGVVAVLVIGRGGSEDIVTTGYAQAPGVQRPSCVDFRGMQVSYVPNMGVNDIAIATHYNGAPVVYYNPNVVATVSAPTAIFFAAHECGHHALGHAVRNIPLTREQEADCFAITELVRQGVFSENEIRIVQAELAAFGRADWTHLPGPQRAINLRECLRSAGTKHRADDSCEYANDGTCDEPNVCRSGTDATDCASASGSRAARADDSCEYANDGTCDEPSVCARGTDATDCGTSGRRRSRPGRDSCEYANDGTCDEPSVCARGTDSTDCSAATRPTPRRAGSNSCEYAFDGTCDEPSVCARGTDTDDCRTSRVPTRRRLGVQVCETLYGSCAMVIAGYPGGSCYCQVGYASVPGSVVER